MGDKLKLNTKLLLGIMIGVFIIMNVSSQHSDGQHSDHGEMDIRIFDGVPHIEFTNDFSNFNISLSIFGGDGFARLLHFPFIQMDDNRTFKYGLNTSIILDAPRRLKYTINSNRTIQSWAYDSYYIPLTNTSSLCYSNPFSPCDSTDPKLYFAQICDITYDENFTVLFNPECVGTLSNNNLTLELEFTLPAGRLEIDPFVTFSSNVIESIEMAVSENDEVVIFYCDETDDDDTFVTYMMNGTLIFGPQDLDTSGGSCLGDNENGVTILRDNKAAFIWGDSGGRIETQQRNYKTTDFVATSVLQSSGNNGANSITRINSTHSMAAWVRATISNTLRAQLVGVGGGINSSFLVDSGLGSSANGLDISANNETHVSIIYHDDAGNSILFGVLSYNETSVTNVTGPITLDTINQDGDAVSIAASNDTVSVLAYNFYAILNPGTVLSRMVLTNGTLIYRKIVDGNIGFTSPTSVSVSIQNSSQYLVGWHDNSVGGGEGEEFSAFFINNGTRVYDIVLVNTSIHPTLEIMSDIPYTKRSICENNLIFAWGKGFGADPGGFTKTYLANGSLWLDGECDVCTYTRGSWNPPCDCNIIENVTMDSNSNLTINGSRTFLVDGATIDVNAPDAVRSFGNSPTDRCTVRLINGGGFK